MDPLNSYGYLYPNYDQLSNNGYPLGVKLECANIPPIAQPVNHITTPQMLPTYPYENTKLPTENIENTTITELNNKQNYNNQQETQNIEEIDTKEHIELLPQHKKKKPQKKKGKTSNYWNKKIVDKNFPFYGCTICNISFKTIQLLDEHVTIHKGRITSYDIRVRNKIKRKEKIKQMKKKKKLEKLGKKEKDCIKKEDNFDIEIKPEDGYIGNEKASEFNENHNIDNNTTMTKDIEALADVKPDEKPKVDDPEDPRLMKLFKCFACQKQFSLSYYLRLHVRSHTDEKPYTCAECGQSFITASKLGRHNKRIHLAIRFQCRICYRFFSRFDILTRHFDKAHSADKIEGEPYDFNAILPYLKELEEQLKQQSESQPKTECSWSDSFGEKQDVSTPIHSLDKEKVKDTNESIDKSTDNTSLDIKVEDIGDGINDNVIITTDGENAAYVKEDKEEDQETLLEDPVKLEPEVDLGVPSGGDDNYSDEDYFPSNTWAATPLQEAPASPIRTRKGRYKSSAFPMQCEFCEKQISTASYYKVHLRTHSGERPFKCYICGRGFITSSKMHRHVMTHDDYWEDAIKNGKKRIKEEDEQTVKEEQQDENNKTKKKKSKKALKSSALKKDVGRHKYRKRSHVCPYCNKRFLHLDTLVVHKKSHDGEEIILKCNFCLEVQPDEETLRSHEATHSGPRPYLCTICNRNYTKKETMVYHRRNHADGTTGEKRAEYICDVCSKSFNAQCKLQRHLVSHKVEKFILRYECPVCAHMFHTKYHIKMHLTTHQKEGLILEENRNEILAMVLQNARKIPRKPHPGVQPEPLPADERSRVCNICGQVFQHFYYLEEHLKSHGSKIAIEDESKEELNKHICPICNKGFKLHYYLKLHSFTHSKERPFICQQCGKGFITKGKLKRHLETHTGLKKFQCHICYKFFTRPSYLRIHVRTIHGTQDYNFSLNKPYVMEMNSV